MKRKPTSRTSRNRAAIVLMGSPGSGKTTLARALLERRPISIVEIGNLLKREVERGTALGEEIAPFTSSGKLVPLDVVIKVISGALRKTRDELVLFDGIPRSAIQILPFLKLLAKHDLELRGVIILTLKLQTALDRLSGRRVCDQCGALYNVAKTKRKICKVCGGKLIQRSDDREEVIRRRFRRFERETMPVIEFFKTEFSDVTWEQSATTPMKQRVDRVWRKLESAISQLAKGNGKLRSET